MKPIIPIMALSVCLSYTACHNPNKQVPKTADTLSTETMLDSVQYRSFLYFWEGGKPYQGMTPERIHLDGGYPSHEAGIVTSGGTGFGIMALLTGMHRGWISAEEGYKRLEEITTFIEQADKFHGAMPHWWQANNKQAIPFGTMDDGADLQETALLMQGILCAVQFYAGGTAQEQQLAERMEQLWKNVEWNFFRQGDKQVLYWHWSPKYKWQMNFPVRGYNECLIMYLLAASSPTHGIPASVYHEGWAENGGIIEPHMVEGIPLHLKYQGGDAGPLFWAHYSFLGLDPRGLKDQYCSDYYQEMRNLTLVNRAYCIRNPHKWKGIGADCWGLTASYSMDGYYAHAPNVNDDKGVISPTAALSSIIYTPKQSLQVMRHLLNMGDKTWGKYGFYDAFSPSADWYPKRYLAIDQGPIVIMIENHRTAFLWRLFMSHPDIKQGLHKLGFTTPDN